MKAAPQALRAQPAQPLGEVGRVGDQSANVKAASAFLPAGRKPYEFKYFMFNESSAFKLLAPLVLQVAEVKLLWRCQKAAAAPANESLPGQADEIQRTQTAAVAGARGYRLDATLQRGVMRLERVISPVSLGQSWNRKNN